MNESESPRRESGIMLEEAVVLLHEHHAAAQHTLRLQAPRIAAAARPGQFAHLRCAPALAMRRPMSIMRAERRRGWIDILYKAHGLGTDRLAQRAVGDVVSVLGPIGKPFTLRGRHSGRRARPLLIGGGVGIPPLVFLADHLRGVAGASPLVLMGSEVPFPFSVRPSRILVDGLPPEVIACMPLLEDWGIASRLASGGDLRGCFHGHVTELARRWLESLDRRERAAVEIFACGPRAMLRAVAALARQYKLPCQIALEEYMACAVGGCAGCAVATHRDGEVAMRRVCVDGPVFAAEEIFPRPAAA